MWPTDFQGISLFSREKSRITTVHGGTVWESELMRHYIPGYVFEPLFPRPPPCARAQADCYGYREATARRGFSRGDRC